MARKTDYFVDKYSIVREIWGRADTVLFIFAGASAEFALNKAVDWLYFTGRLPADPLGRLFSTVAYARQIVFSEMDAAHKTIDQIHAIHSAVEAKRHQSIPDWAYRDVLFMLIHYSIASFELLNRKLSIPEKEEVYQVFYRVGYRMGLSGLPSGYDAWVLMRDEHIKNDLVKSSYTADLFRQYKKHLGIFRYFLLIEVQKMLVPAQVRKLLGIRSWSVLFLILPLYKFSRKFNLDWLLKSVLLPDAYKAQIKAIDYQYK